MLGRVVVIGGGVLLLVIVLVVLVVVVVVGIDLGDELVVVVGSVTDEGEGNVGLASFLGIGELLLLSISRRG